MSKKIKSNVEKECQEGFFPGGYDCVRCQFCVNTVMIDRDHYVICDVDSVKGSHTTKKAVLARAKKSAGNIKNNDASDRTNPHEKKFQCQVCNACFTVEYHLYFDHTLNDATSWIAESDDKNCHECGSWRIVEKN